MPESIIETPTCIPSLFSSYLSMTFSLARSLAVFKSPFAPGREVPCLALLFFLVKLNVDYNVCILCIYFLTTVAFVLPFQGDMNKYMCIYYIRMHVWKRSMRKRKEEPKKRGYIFFPLHFPFRFSVTTHLYLLLPIYPLHNPPCATLPVLNLSKRKDYLPQEPRAASMRRCLQSESEDEFDVKFKRKEGLRKASHISERNDDDDDENENENEKAMYRGKVGNYGEEEVGGCDVLRLVGAKQDEYEFVVDLDEVDATRATRSPGASTPNVCYRREKGRERPMRNENCVRAIGMMEA